MNTVFVNGIEVKKPVVYVGYVAYGDTSNPAHFVIIDRIVQVSDVDR